MMRGVPALGASESSQDELAFAVCRDCICVRKWSRMGVSIARFSRRFTPKLWGCHQRWNISPRAAAYSLRQAASAQTMVLVRSLIGAYPPAESPYRVE